MITEKPLIRRGPYVGAEEIGQPQNALGEKLGFGWPNFWEYQARLVEIPDVCFEEDATSRED